MVSPSFRIFSLLQYSELTAISKESRCEESSGCFSSRRSISEPALVPPGISRFRLSALMMSLMVAKLRRVMYILFFAFITLQHKEVVLDIRLVTLMKIAEFNVFWFIEYERQPGL